MRRWKRQKWPVPRSTPTVPGKHVPVLLNATNTLIDSSICTTNLNNVSCKKKEIVDDNIYEPTFSGTNYIQIGQKVEHFRPYCTQWGAFLAEYSSNRVKPHRRAWWPKVLETVKVLASTLCTSLLRMPAMERMRCCVRLSIRFSCLKDDNRSFSPFPAKEKARQHTQTRQQWHL